MDTWPGYPWALLFERRQTFLIFLRQMVHLKKVQNYLYKTISRPFSLQDRLCILKLVGKEPTDKEWLMLERISGLTVWNTSVRNLVGMLPNWQVDEPTNWVISSKTGREMSSKWDKVAEVSLWSETLLDTSVTCWPQFSGWRVSRCSHWLG